MLASAQYETVTVVSGDTLWSIAEDHSVDGVTTANMVDVIREANHLESACLYGGMQLLVPTI
jgi:LysM repeat protein